MNDNNVSSLHRQEGEGEWNGVDGAKYVYGYV